MASRRIRLEGVLGRGTYGAVHRGWLETGDGFSKPVAVKRLHPEAAAEPEHVARLRDEARILGLVRHRAIVRVDGLAWLDGGWALVMEHVPGVNLRRLLQEGPIPAAVAVEIVAEVANALHVAYTWDGPEGPLRLVHRDLKPSNLQVTPSGEVRVLDFGIARADLADREACTNAEILGSLGYMSPERLDGIDGPAGDVYAMGVVAWEMLLGRRLGRTSTHRHRHECFHREASHDLREVLGRDEADLADLILRMLAYDPADRPSAKDVERTCRSLRRRLEGEWLTDWAARVVRPLSNDRPASAPADVASLSLRFGPRRWPVVATAAAAALLGALVVGAVASLRAPAEGVELAMQALPDSAGPGEPAGTPGPAVVGPVVPSPPPAAEAPAPAVAVPEPPPSRPEPPPRRPEPPPKRPETAAAAVVEAVELAPPPPPKRPVRVAPPEPTPEPATDDVPDAILDLAGDTGVDAADAFEEEPVVLPVVGPAP